MKKFKIIIFKLLFKNEIENLIGEIERIEKQEGDGWKYIRIGMKRTLNSLFESNILRG